jgi:hypothetical protein
MVSGRMGWGIHLPTRVRAERRGVPGGRPRRYSSYCPTVPRRSSTRAPERGVSSQTATGQSGAGTPTRDESVDGMKVHLPEAFKTNGLKPRTDRRLIYETVASAVNKMLVTVGCHCRPTADFFVTPQIGAAAHAQSIPI